MAAALQPSTDPACKPELSFFFGAPSILIGTGLNFLSRKRVEDMWTRPKPTKRLPAYTKEESEAENLQPVETQKDSEESDAESSSDTSSASESCDDVKGKGAKNDDSLSENIGQMIDEHEQEPNPKEPDEQQEPPPKKLKRSHKYTNLADVEQNRRTASKSKAQATTGESVTPAPTSGESVAPAKAKGKVKPKGKAKPNAKAKTVKFVASKEKGSSSSKPAEPKACPPPKAKAPSYAPGFDLFAASQLAIATFCNSLRFLLLSEFERLIRMTSSARLARALLPSCWFQCVLKDRGVADRTY